jgi:hypothetical protein
MLMAFPLRFRLALLFAVMAPALSITVLPWPSGSHGAIRTTTSAAAHAVTPSATDFTAKFVGVSNAYAIEHGDAGRIGNPHCVEAAAGRYMCSYAVVRPGALTECHLMQARWTPNVTSSFTVTLAGRAGKCGSLREAIRTLG